MKTTGADLINKLKTLPQDAVVTILNTYLERDDLNLIQVVKADADEAAEIGVIEPGQEIISL